MTIKKQISHGAIHTVCHMHKRVYIKYVGRETGWFDNFSKKRFLDQRIIELNIS